MADVAPAPDAAPAADAPPADAAPAPDAGAPPAADGGAPPPAEGGAPPADGGAPPADGGAPPTSQRGGGGGGGFPSGAAGSDAVAHGNQYSQELQATFDGLRQRGARLADTLQQVASNGQASFDSTITEAISTLQQLDGDISTPSSVVLQTFGWTSVLAAGASIGFLVGANALGGIIGNFFGGFTLALLALVALPYYTYTNMGNAGSDTETRMFLLAYAGAAGLFLGSVLNQTYYFAEPFAFSTPLIVALTFAYAAPSLGNSRQNLIGAAVGGAFAVNTLIAMFTGSLSGPFLFLNALYAFAAFATLQFLFKGVSGEGPTHVYMFGYTTAFLYAKGVSYYLMGLSEPYQNSN